MKRIVVTCVVMVLVPALFWLGGFNFDERGFAMAACAAYTIFAGIFSYFFPGAWE